MNKTIIIGLIVTLVLLIAPFVSAANACKVQTKEKFTLTTIGVGSGGTATEIGNILLTKGENGGTYFIEVGVGTNPAIYPDPKLSTTSVDSLLNVVTGEGYDYVKETIVFADGSTLVLHAVEHFTGCVAPYTSFKGTGSLEGYGTGALYSVIVSGKTSFYISMTQGLIDTCSGIVIGWPT